MFTIREREVGLHRDEEEKSCEEKDQSDEDLLFEEIKIPSKMALESKKKTVPEIAEEELLVELDSSEKSNE